MKYIYLAATAVLMSGCPEAPVDIVEVPEECSEAYAESVILNKAAVDNPTKEERDEAVAAACDAALSALDNGTSPEFWDWYDNYHTPAWKNQTEDMVEHCKDNLEYKAKMLEDSEIFKFRCIMECDGFDEESC